MKKILILVMLFSLTAFTNVNVPVEIYWSKDFKMTKEHFVQKSDIEPGKAASIATEIRLNTNYNGVGAGRAFAIFNTQQSYIKPGLNDWQLGIVLTHEQTHFNITEYHVRILNGRLSSVKDPGAMIAAYNYQVRERDLMQEQFDRETNHGLIDSEQKKWDEKMNKLLNIK